MPVCWQHRCLGESPIGNYTSQSWESFSHIVNSSQGRYRLVQKDDQIHGAPWPIVLTVVSQISFEKGIANSRIGSDLRGKDSKTTILTSDSAGQYSVGSDMSRIVSEANSISGASIPRGSRAPNQSRTAWLT